MDIAKMELNLSRVRFQKRLLGLYERGPHETLSDTKLIPFLNDFCGFFESDNAALFALDDDEYAACENYLWFDHGRLAPEQRGQYERALQCLRRSASDLAKVYQREQFTEVASVTARNLKDAVQCFPDHPLANAGWSNANFRKLTDQRRVEPLDQQLAKLMFTDLTTESARAKTVRALLCELDYEPHKIDSALAMLEDDFE